MSKTIGKGDVVRVTGRALGDVRKVHPFISATEELRVTRVSREVGKSTLFLRNQRNELFLLWPAQVEIIRRAAPEPRRAVR